MLVVQLSNIFLDRPSLDGITLYAILGTLLKREGFFNFWPRPPVMLRQFAVKSNKSQSFSQNHCFCSETLKTDQLNRFNLSHNAVPPG